MSAPNAGNAPAIFDLRSASVPMLALVLKTTDMAELARELNQRFGTTPDLFAGEPVVIDLSQVADASKSIDWARCLELLRSHKMAPMAVKGGRPEQQAEALAAGLPTAADDANLLPVPKPETVVRTVVQVQEVEREVVREVVAAGDTVVIDKPLRSGQQVYARGGDLVVLAQVNYGAEVIADGSVHVYAPLRGKAIAGARGNTTARIFSTCMEPDLIAIAGIYRTTESPLPTEVLGKPAQIRLEGEKLVVEPLKI